MKTLFVKMRGVSKAPPVARRDEIMLAFVGSCLALGLMACCTAFASKTPGCR